MGRIKKDEEIISIKVRIKKDNPNKEKIKALVAEIIQYLQDENNDQSQYTQA